MVRETDVELETEAVDATELPGPPGPSLTVVVVSSCVGVPSPPSLLTSI